MPPLEHHALAVWEIMEVRWRPRATRRNVLDGVEVSYVDTACYCAERGKLSFA
jgi:hypothetical protein